mmetsp:Transcript_24929/g.57965  ORF Transcript_24929/g.57965 Transcript_24929/m.57965 type:complete len:236 (+) Transcript_24929:819-1526(+)
MWLTRGKKAWRLLLPPVTVGRATVGLQDCPDLFNCEAIAQAMPRLLGARLLFTDLAPGELLFIPSRSMHAVRNIAPGLTLAVSHNFIDAACLPATLHDLREALEALLTREASGQCRDEALEELSNVLEGPLSVLLAASLRAPSALASIVATANAELASMPPSINPMESAPGMVLESIAVEWPLCQAALKRALSGPPCMTVKRGLDLLDEDRGCESHCRSTTKSARITKSARTADG